MKKLTTLRLAAATYFLVAGGPYGLEELIEAGGYARAAIVIMAMPLLFSLPIAFMVGELATALPEEGGYYAWTRRAFGPTWGFADAWFSLCASFFDMAIYPTLFVMYLARVIPGVDQGATRVLLGLALVAACTAWNLRGARSVGNASLALSVVLMIPFLFFVVAAMRSDAPPPPEPETSAPLGAGLVVAMWNFMGWDNASTFAAEVERPQRSYPRAMALAVGAVTLIYLIPVVAAARTGLAPAAWTTGAWVEGAEVLGGPWLARAVVVGGALCGLGMFNVLLMSFSRLPAAMAQDGMLPLWLARTNRRGVPWPSVIVCAVLYTAGLFFSFKRLVEIDLLFYGASILLEFAALVALRIKEPALVRPFRVPGGTVGAALLGVVPAILFVIAFVREAQSGEDHTMAVLAGAACLVAGWLVWRWNLRQVA